MKHPLVNPSLTPLGFGVGNTYNRTSWKSNGHMLNGDWAAAKFWQEANRLSSEYRPAEHIVHEIMPGMRTLGRTTKGDLEFDGKSYLEHDLSVLTGIKVFLGTNNGRAMLYNPLHHSYAQTSEFPIRWRAREKPQFDGYMLWRILHECTTDTCENARVITSCNMQHPLPTEREQLLLDAFLFWLGTKSGREYLAAFEAFFKETEQAVYHGFLQREDPKQWRLLKSLKQQNA